ncbi:hypothetical protein F5B20DRAFT_438695 [Whalleya microplaca]|nr:hypothetical protein F5B20DRAFT_438695 [Whalleya microplaca]
MMPADEHTTTEIIPDLKQSMTMKDSESEERLLLQPVAYVSPDLSDLLWDETYDEVKREHSDIVTWYEQTLTTMLEWTGERELTLSTSSSSFDPFETRISQTDRGTRRTKMKELLENWLHEDNTEDEREEIKQYNNDTEEEAGIITCRKILRKAVESARPNALLAWVGGCFASRVLLSPKASNKDDCLDLVYVISRMDWYGRLPRLLSKDANADYTQCQLKKRVIHLYKAIISYEVNISCSQTSRFEECNKGSNRAWNRSI